eukprot:Gregarina_sp_Poly_1__5799@NODE_304_length_9736_cov_136_409039_g263_i0_p1_GENE_NODE_304_length_9736_cov_136_409039_g263_i0NODE_304_length_9736_cov_136_409039_g263_i0_p1_ORF_typecomplete_len475_score49_32_NODE_304_length_9736_cov_136_409039_g263_i07762200
MSGHSTKREILGSMRFVAAPNLRKVANGASLPDLVFQVVASGALNFGGTWEFQREGVFGSFERRLLFELDGLPRVLNEVVVQEPSELSQNNLLMRCMNWAVEGSKTDFSNSDPTTPESVLLSSFADSLLRLARSTVGLSKHDALLCLACKTSDPRFQCIVSPLVQNNLRFWTVLNNLIIYCHRMTTEESKLIVGVVEARVRLAILYFASSHPNIAKALDLEEIQTVSDQMREISSAPYFHFHPTNSHDIDFTPKSHERKALRKLAKLLVPDRKSEDYRVWRQLLLRKTRIQNTLRQWLGARQTIENQIDENTTEPRLLKLQWICALGEYFSDLFPSQSKGSSTGALEGVLRLPFPSDRRAKLLYWSLISCLNGYEKKRSLSWETGLIEQLQTYESLVFGKELPIARRALWRFLLMILASADPWLATVLDMPLNVPWHTLELPIPHDEWIELVVSPRNAAFETAKPSEGIEARIV